MNEYVSNTNQQRRKIKFIMCPLFPLKKKLHLSNKISLLKWNKTGLTGEKMSKTLSNHFKLVFTASKRGKRVAEINRNY